MQGPQQSQKDFILDRVKKHGKSCSPLFSSYSKSKYPKQQMQWWDDRPLCPSCHTCVTLLKSCAKLHDLEKCISIHNDIVKLGFLDSDLFVGSSLVDTYAKCGSIVRAQEAFDNLPRREVVSWTALLSGYVRHGYDDQAIELFESMLFEGISPNAHTYVCMLKACGNLGSTKRVLELHEEKEKKGLLDDNDPFVGSALINIYSKCGLLAKAQQVFNKFPVRDVVSWTALISGYVEHDYGEEALHCFQQMKFEHVQPSIVSYVCVVKACTSVGAIDVGQEIHGEIERRGLFQKDLVVGNVLVDMYAKCGYLILAKEVFDKLCTRDVISWTSLIAGYADHGHEKEALKCFEKMQCDSVSPNPVTLISCLKACCSLEAIDKVRELHGEIERKGLLEKNAILANTLIDMYAKHGFLSIAQGVFDELLTRDVITWTTLIVGYTEYGYGTEAIRCFEQMQLDGVPPNVVTVICTLKACTSIGAIHKGQMIHTEIKKHTLLERNLVINNALIDMYAKCGLLNIARHVFDELPIQDVVSWASLILGYAEHGHEEEALKCYEMMQLDGVLPDAVIFMSILKACGIIGATAKGIQIHAQIERQGLLEMNLAVGNTLIDMYAKSGSPTRAQHVFDRLQIRDVVSWNALLTGYAQSGESDHVFHFFEKMLGQGIEPDLVSFLVVMCACTRNGLFHKSKTYFETMTKDYGMIPTIQHQSCIVDLLGRMGEVDKAVEMIKKMPLRPNLVVWHTVLGASRYWGSASIGKQAFKKAIHLDKNDAVAYIMMSHILASMDFEDSRMLRTTKL